MSFLEQKGAIGPQELYLILKIPTPSGTLLPGTFLRNPERNCRVRASGCGCRLSFRRQFLVSKKVLRGVLPARSFLFLKKYTGYGPLAALWWALAVYYSRCCTPRGVDVLLAVLNIPARLLPGVEALCRLEALS